MNVASLDLATTAERRQHLREAIAKLALVIAEGGGTPSQVELHRIIELCHDHFLPTEAARVRRWMTP